MPQDRTCKLAIEKEKSLSDKREIRIIYSTQIYSFSFVSTLKYYKYVSNVISLKQIAAIEMESVFEPFIY